MRVRSLLLPAAIICAVILARPLTAQSVSVRYLWKTGEALTYRTTVQTAVNMSGVPGLGDMALSTAITQVIRMMPEDIAADGTATLRVTIESMKMEMTSPMGNMAFDSAAPAPAPDDAVAAALAPTIKAVVGASFTTIIKPNGAVTSVSGLAAIAAKLQQALPQGAGMATGLESFLNDDAMKSAMQQSFASLPDRPVATGESWKSDVTVANPMMTMTSSTTYILNGFDTAGGGQVARIAFTSVLKPKAGGSPPASPLPVTVTPGDGKAEGEILMDVRNGRLTRSTMRMDQPMSMSMQGGDASAMTISANTKSTTTVELVQK